jgi:hypothetical protein
MDANQAEALIGLFVIRINTWTRISSFQISTFFAFASSISETPDYTEAL